MRSPAARTASGRTCRLPRPRPGEGRARRTPPAPHTVCRPRRSTPAPTGRSRARRGRGWPGSRPARRARRRRSQSPIVTTVDARGLACPLPLTMAKRQMAALAPGETLLVLATDPEAPIALAAGAAGAGHASAERDGVGYREFTVGKLGPARPAGPR